MKVRGEVDSQTTKFTFNIKCLKTEHFPSSPALLSIHRKESWGGEWVLHEEEGGEQGGGSVAAMPLYDCVLMVKPMVDRRTLVGIMARLGRVVYTNNGVVTDVKSFGNVHLAYPIKKLGTKFYEGQMMQMTMMANPKVHEQLYYLSKEEVILRWMLVKNHPTPWMRLPPPVDAFLQ
eukprot:c14946_g1_i1 orf=157-684(+)